jgi:hypothetical protein
MKKAASARVQVLLANDSPQGALIRRDPSKKTGIIGWNRLNDTFQVGQWLKGKIYPERCDITPDGKNWKAGLTGEQMLVDTNLFTFEKLPAPY